MTREENIQELLGDARVFDAEHGTGLSGYLAHVALMTSEDRSGVDEETVSLMSIHAAKGREFDHVHVVGLEEVADTIWTSVQEPTAISDVCSTVLAEFEADATQVEADTLDFVGRLVDNDLVTVHGS